MTDLTYSEEFQYSHKNPYHQRLEAFSQFVFRDSEAEQYRGKWNSDIFKKEAPLILEIGTGYGHFLRDYCRQNPEVNFVGLDYRFKRSFQLAKSLARDEIENYRYLRARGERIEFIFGESELDQLYYFFPDPWPKNPHKKKRLFQEGFIERAHRVLKPGARFYIKTDHRDYGAQMIRLDEESKLFDVELVSLDLHREHPDFWLNSYPTKFEKIFIAKNEPIIGLVLVNKK